ncbi:hypothetical protein M5K25_001112 [Dendrobium thyrsiflorum]|uniref:Reverse transcriptase zinc-binding domain-containing protein n=1 Tax=Dendrobium thyrsiflorum TaxID=117978 RepID=A0ABD0VYW0_DENTH
MSGNPSLSARNSGRWAGTATGCLLGGVCGKLKERKCLPGLGVGGPGGGRLVLPGVGRVAGVWGVELPEGRMQYIKYTISNLVAYWIRGTSVPKTITKAIGKACSKFLYHGGSHTKHLHLISWSNTTKPHSRGGLGIVSFHALKSAFTCGMIIRFYNLPVVLLVKNQVNPGSPISIFWDHWCFNNRITSLGLHIPISSNATLAEWINYGCWSLPDALSHNIKQAIHTIPISTSFTHHITWDNNENANFKDFYHEVFAAAESVSWSHLVWHKSNSLRHSVFTWLALCGGLKTAETLCKRNIHIEDPVCPLCHSHFENTVHLLFECDYSFNVLTKLIPQLHIFYFRPNLVQVLLHIDGLILSKDIKNGLLLILHVIVYYLWKERNSRKFRSNVVCAITLSKLIARQVYIKLDKWKSGNLIKEKLHLKYY